MHLNTTGIRTLIPFLLCLALLSGCDSEKEPIRLGFVGGLSGRVADLGMAGRDGALLAVEEANRAGGIRGHRIELLVRNDRQDPLVAVKVDQELVSAGVAAIVGHMTSAMSLAGLPVANAHKVLMFSPTTSTNELTGIDDYFFRNYPASAQTALLLARHVAEEMAAQRVAVVYDLANRAHTESYFEHFRRELEGLGSTVSSVTTFTSGPQTRFLDLARRIDPRQTDALLILANAMDTAMLAQQLEKLGHELPIVTSGWSATAEVLEFGGRAVEGIQFFNTYDRNHSGPRYRRFRDDFLERFGYRGGFASAHAYDAANVILQALRVDPDPDRLRETIIEIGTFEGLQDTLTIDRFGDVVREHVLMTIHDSRLRPVE